MIDIITIYLLIGLGHMFMIGGIVYLMQKYAGDDHVIEYRHTERILTIFFWPVLSLIFWYNFIMVIFKKW
jgi:hypothetical protein